MNNLLKFRYKGTFNSNFLALTVMFLLILLSIGYNGISSIITFILFAVSIYYLSSIFLLDKSTNVNNICIAKNEIFIIFFLFSIIVLFSFYFQYNVYRAGFVGQDHSLIENMLQNVIKNGVLSADSSTLLSPDDGLGTMLAFYEVEKLTNFFSVHFAPSMYLFAFFRMFFPNGMEWLLTATSVWVSFSFIICYYILRFNWNTWQSFVIAFLWFFFPIGSGVLLNVPHPVILAIPFLLISILLIQRDKFYLYFLSLIITLGFQETMPFFTFLFSIFLWKKSKKIAILTILLSLLYFVLANYLVNYFVHLQNLEIDRKGWEAIAFGDKMMKYGSPIKYIVYQLVTSPINLIKELYSEQKIMFIIEAFLLSGLALFAFRLGTLLIFFSSIYSQILLGEDLGRGTAIFEYHWHYVAFLFPAFFLVIALYSKELKEKQKITFIFLYVLIGAYGYINYGQYWGSRYWFNISTVNNFDRMPVFKNLDVHGTIAVTNRSANLVASTNRTFNIDYFAAQYSDWPDVSAAIIATDLGYVDEWSFIQLNNRYLSNRAILEKKGFSFVEESKGYQLWKKNIDSEQKIVDNRLLRKIGAESLHSKVALKSDTIGFYREFVSNTTTTDVLCYGPYVSLMPLSTKIKINIESNIQNFENDLFEIKILYNGKLVLEKMFKYSIDNNYEVFVDESYLNKEGKYEIVLIAQKQKDLILKFRGYSLESIDDYLQNEDTFFLEVKNCKVSIPFWVLEGDYKVEDGFQIEPEPITSKASFIKTTNSLKNEFELIRGNTLTGFNIANCNSETKKYIKLKINSINKYSNKEVLK